MKRTIIIRIVAAVVLAVFVGETWLTSGKLNLSWAKYFSLVVLIATAILWLWDTWLWRLPLFQRLPGVPRSVRGTWKGTLTSFWKDPTTGKSPQPKTVYLVVRQTGTLVSVKLLTNESSSASSLAEVSVVDASAVLNYMYLNRPGMQVEHRSRMHHGSTVLDISGSPARRLQGRYWTDRDSKGELEFTERCPKLADDFADATELFTL
jgi:hypothetical protein